MECGYNEQSKKVETIGYFNGRFAGISVRIRLYPCFYSFGWTKTALRYNSFSAYFDFDWSFYVSILVGVSRNERRKSSIICSKGIRVRVVCKSKKPHWTSYYYWCGFNCCCCVYSHHLVIEK